MTPEERRERLRSNRAYLKSQHRCTKCGKRDERTEAGRYLCQRCAAKELEYQAARRRAMTLEQRHRERLRERARKAARRAAGICPNCGGALDREGSICSKCLARYRARRKEAAR